MNKKLENLGRIFIDKYLGDYGIYLNEKEKTILLTDESDIQEHYNVLRDIFDDIDQTHLPIPFIRHYVVESIEVKNGWIVDYNGRTYKDGDIIKI